MKKICCIIICLAIGLIFAGCSKKSSGVTAVTAGLSFTAEITYENNEIISDAVIDKNGKAVFTVASPEVIKGMCYSFKGDSAEIGYGGLTYPINTAYENAFSVLFEIFNTVRNDEKNILLSDDMFFYSGKGSFGEFELYLGESGLPISVSFSEKDIEILFKNATII